MDMELCLGKYEEPAESLWVKIKGRAVTGILKVPGTASIDMLQATELDPSPEGNRRPDYPGQREYSGSQGRLCFSLQWQVLQPCCPN